MRENEMKYILSGVVSVLVLLLLVVMLFSYGRLITEDTDIGKPTVIELGKYEYSIWIDSVEVIDGVSQVFTAARDTSITDSEEIYGMIGFSKDVCINGGLIRVEIEDAVQYEPWVPTNKSMFTLAAKVACKRGFEVEIQ